MKTICYIILALVVAVMWLAVTGCVPQAFPVGTPNPLDTPGESEDVAADLHALNLRAITR